MPTFVVPDHSGRCGYENFYTNQLAAFALDKHMIERPHRRSQGRPCIVCQRLSWKHSDGNQRAILLNGAGCSFDELLRMHDLPRRSVVCDWRSDPRYR